MQNILLTTIMALSAFLPGCGQPLETDSVISSLENKNFDDMKGYFAHYYGAEGESIGSSVIFVGKYGLNCSPYIVDVIIKDGQEEFININSELAVKSCGYDYIDQAQVKSLVSSFVSYGVTLLGVDTAGNVYVNPSSQDLATLVKVRDFAKVNNAALYKPYKGEWYIRE